MFEAENVSGLTGTDEVDHLILLCMQKSPRVFELTAGGAGLSGKCLACIAPDKNNSHKEGDYHEYEAETE